MSELVIREQGGAWVVMYCERVKDEQGIEHVFDMGVVEGGFTSERGAEIWRKEYVRPVRPGHPRWDEFYERLSGPEGCDFRKDESGHEIWTCDSQDKTRPFCRSIMLHMDIGPEARDASLEYFSEHGGFCDCEVLFNVDPRHDD